MYSCLGVTVWIGWNLFERGWDQLGFPLEDGGIGWEFLWEQMDWSEFLERGFDW